MKKAIDPSSILGLKFKSSDLNKRVTVRQFLSLLLERLWDEGEGFSGKRPFGSSGWKSDLEVAFIKAKIIEGSLDEYGYIEDSDTPEFDRIMLEVIKALSCPLTSGGKVKP